jgi:hypothetical protein
MNLHDLESRLERLDQLTRGLAKEVILWKECNEPRSTGTGKATWQPSGPRCPGWSAPALRSPRHGRGLKNPGHEPSQGPPRQYGAGVQLPPPYPAQGLGLLAGPVPRFGLV